MFGGGILLQMNKIILSAVQKKKKRFALKLVNPIKYHMGYLCFAYHKFVYDNKICAQNLMTSIYGGNKTCRQSGEFKAQIHVLVFCPLLAITIWGTTKSCAQKLIVTNRILFVATTTGVKSDAVPVLLQLPGIPVVTEVKW